MSERHSTQRARLKQPSRFTVSKHSSGYYQVSIPDYEGGEVVKAGVVTALVEALNQARSFIRSGDGLAKVVTEPHVLALIESALAAAKE